MGFWPYFFTLWHFDVILANIGFLVLFLYTCEFLSYPFRDWYSDLIIPSIGILVLFLKTLEFLCYPSTASIGILSMHLDSGPSLYKHWNFYLILSKICILTLLFHALEFWPYSWKHWNSYFILPLQTLQFSSYLSIHLDCGLFYTHWNSDLLRSSIGLLVLSFLTL